MKWKPVIRSECRIGGNSLINDIKNIPPPPEKPDPDSCCGSGCVPCIFDYYDTALLAWAEKHAGLTTWQEAEILAAKFQAQKKP